MEFININNGLVYNGSSPYIHYFDEGQSININYVKTLCVLSSKEKIRIECNSEIFSLIDPNKLDNLALNDLITLSQKQFILLDHITAKSYESIGVLYNQQYIHMIYVLGFSKDAGEILDTINIDGEAITIGADFYGEDERLRNSLENFENVVPESIQRAIYDCNVHEEANDNILLNRKYKELLQNYWNICMSKGSYTSLIDSLAWFEWGDLIRLEEYWKRNDPQGEVFMQFPVGKILNDEMRNALVNVSKTTYYGLYCCLYKELPNTFDSEGNPKLDNVLFRWSIQDISLKMILLGNFYQTYFMPIHLDLLHSSIEHWVFTVNQKILNHSEVEFNNTFNNVKTFDAVYDKQVYLKPNSAYFYNDTLFNNGYLVTAVENSLPLLTPKTLGVCSALRKMSSSDVYSHCITSYYKDICAITKITCDLKGINIKHSKIICVNEDGTTLTSTDDKVFGVENGLTFEILLEKPGQWNIVIEFETIDSVIYTKELNVYVIDTLYNTIDLYKLIYKASPSTTDFLISNEDIYFNLSISSKTEYQNMHYINVQNDDLNRVMLYTIPEHKDILNINLIHSGIHYTNTICYANAESVLQELIDICGDRYIWCIMGEEHNDASPLRLVGVCKEQGIDSNITFKYNDDYRYLDEPRFVLGFYDIEKFDDICITTNDIIVAIPRFKHSKPIDTCHWNFHNDSTGKDNLSYYYNNRYVESGEYMNDYGEYIESSAGSIGNTCLSKNMSKLSKGFYSISLKYMFGNSIQESHLNSAFYIK